MTNTKKYKGTCAMKVLIVEMKLVKYRLNRRFNDIQIHEYEEWRPTIKIKHQGLELAHTGSKTLLLHCQIITCQLVGFCQKDQSLYSV